MELGWETTFNSDLNADGFIGTPPVEDINNDGLVDGGSTYKIFNNGQGITIKDTAGNTFSDAFTPYWNAAAATSYGSGYQVLLKGATSLEGQYYIWDTDYSGVITNGSGWKTAEQAVELGWETTFKTNLDLNGDGFYGPATNNLSTLSFAPSASSAGLSTSSSITTSASSSTIDNITGSNSIGSSINTPEIKNDELINNMNNPDDTTISLDQGNNSDSSETPLFEIVNNPTEAQNLPASPESTDESMSNNLPIEPIKPDTILI